MSGPQRPSEVRPYLKRLLLSIAIGVICMASAAVWSWKTYGKKLETAPPLPSGSPPLSTVPVPNPPKTR